MEKKRKEQNSSEEERLADLAAEAYVKALTIGTYETFYT